MMDQPATRAVEEFVHAGYPLDAAGDPAVRIRRHAGGSRRGDRAASSGAARSRRDRNRVSRDEAERLRFWSGRKAAFPAVGRLSPDYYCMDGTIPRKRLGEVLRHRSAMENEVRLRCPNVFHAGDGNLHPLILFDANIPASCSAPRRSARDPRALRGVGGTITGEHGVGIEKINQMCSSSPAGARAFHAVKAAFDPAGLLNPGKAVPTLHALRGVRPHARARFRKAGCNSCLCRCRCCRCTLMGCARRG
jgi:glycolate oxidase